MKIEKDFLLANRFCATDMWDEWDEDPDDFLNYRHQRRLSDPSANLNNFSRYGWKTKGGSGADGTSAGAKARSENEGLDSLASEVSEIEAGDLKDGTCHVHFFLSFVFMCGVRVCVHLFHLVFCFQFFLNTDSKRDRMCS